MPIVKRLQEYSHSPPFMAIVLCRLEDDCQAIVTRLLPFTIWTETDEPVIADFHTILEGLHHCHHPSTHFRDIKKALNKCLKIFQHHPQKEMAVKYLTALQATLDLMPRSGVKHNQVH